ncbi:hypothetical protein LMG29542_07488 [Paraburkholderia humisilvae]|uniref:Uncharacterized protein n=1 Tax=Paraburkholderia humisilvae TaxID=627669 RepID=A0A6J5F5U8_9BURK|nr:hypothetical protein LMG29542_07488 [Paraburkholderia humisilvae]
MQLRAYTIEETDLFDRGQPACGGSNNEAPYVNADNDIGGVVLSGFLQVPHAITGKRPW